MGGGGCGGGGCGGGEGPNGAGNLVYLTFANMKQALIFGALLPLLGPLAPDHLT